MHYTVVTKGYAVLGLEIIEHLLDFYFLDVLNVFICPQNGFDAGARFDGITQQVIPPNPPGVPPSAAQLAAMAGHGIALGQKKNSFLAGGSDGGYTFW